jgi:thiol-disulfide isomerase/thioredoxin
VGLIISCTKKSASSPQEKIEELFRKMKTLDDQNLSLDNFKNKIIIINFWASWCPPCMEETPSLLKMVHQYSQDVVLISISEDDGQKDLKKFMELFPLSKSNNVFIFHDSGRKWSEAFNVYKFPETFVFDKNHKQVEHFEGGVPFGDIKVQMFFKKLTNWAL